MYLTLTFRFFVWLFNSQQKFVSMDGMLNYTIYKKHFKLCLSPLY